MTAEHLDAGIAARVRHVEALLEARGVVAPGEIDRRVDENLAGGTPAHGFRIVAHAWTDDGFRARLLQDANAAIGELGLSMTGGLQEQTLRVVENTADVHNLVVCTLCSCYPLALLGPSPSWYKSEAYRSRAVREPRAVLREFGIELPATTAVTVWDASAETRYMVLPAQPGGTDGLSEEALAARVTRKGLIGTALL